MMEYDKQETNLNENCQKAYVLIFRHFTKNMRSKIEAHKDYQRIGGGYDVFLLVADIKGPPFKLYGHKHPSHSLHEYKRDFTAVTRQGRLQIRSS